MKSLDNTKYYVFRAVDGRLAKDPDTASKYIGRKLDRDSGEYRIDKDHMVDATDIKRLARLRKLVERGDLADVTDLHFAKIAKDSKDSKYSKLSTSSASNK